MPKTATYSLRLDEELKDGAQKVLDEMGLPMSLAIELYLRQIVAKGRLPFALGTGGTDPEEDERREIRERDFWKAFTLWYFKVWPHFSSEEARQQAKEELGFDELTSSIFKRLHDFIGSEADNEWSRTDEERWQASSDVYRLDSLLSDAKELIYWALDMERAFVPSLTTRYSSQTDDWCLRYLREQVRCDD